MKASPIFKIQVIYNLEYGSVFQDLTMGPSID